MCVFVCLFVYVCMVRRDFSERNMTTMTWTAEETVREIIVFDEGVMHEFTGMALVRCFVACPALTTNHTCLFVCAVYCASVCVCLVALCMKVCGCSSHSSNHPHMFLYEFQLLI